MRALFVILATLATAGCATIYSVTHGPDQNDIYGGVRLDVRILGAALTNGRVHCGLENCSQSSVWFMSWGAACDLPLSLVADTVLLPYTALK